MSICRSIYFAAGAESGAATFPARSSNTRFFFDMLLACTERCHSQSVLDFFLPEKNEKYLALEPTLLASAFRLQQLQNAGRDTRNLVLAADK